MGDVVICPWCGFRSEGEDPMTRTPPDDTGYAEAVARDLRKRLDAVRREAAGLALEDAARWQDREAARAVKDMRPEVAQVHAEVAGGLRKRAAGG